MVLSILAIELPIELPIELTIGLPIALPIELPIGGLGRLPTVRQSYLQSGKATYCQAKLPTARQEPNRSVDLHPAPAYSHPRVSEYFAPKNRILCTQPLHRLAPKIRIHAPKSFCIHALNSAYMHLIARAY